MKAWKRTTLAAIGVSTLFVGCIFAAEFSTASANDPKTAAPLRMEMLKAQLKQLSTQQVQKAELERLLKLSAGGSEAESIITGLLKELPSDHEIDLEREAVMIEFQKAKKLGGLKVESMKVTEPPY